jgi:hypothetical protein
MAMGLNYDLLPMGLVACHVIKIRMQEFQLKGVSA